ncbi:MAG TPA: Uma2 family endonuclease [Gemmataceae bacterium]|nr:Uma2 family endonuclease [Gemmataceae bacterium]
MGMGIAIPKPMSAEEFYEWGNRPENRDRFCELERGQIIDVPRPGKRHGFVCANVAGILGNFAVTRKKGYVCSNGTGVIVERNPDTVRGTDVLFFEDAQRLELVEQGYGEEWPLLVVEVLSAYGRGWVDRRVSEFLRRGVPLVWVVDPKGRTVTVFRRGKDLHVREEMDDLTGEDVLHAFRCRVAEFFALPGA